MAWITTLIKTSLLARKSSFSFHPWSFFQSQLRKSPKKSLDWTKIGSWARHMASADRHFPSVDWHSLEAWPRNALIEIKWIHFDFLGIRTQPNSYLIQSSLFFKHPTSKNREETLEIGAFFFWLLCSPYVKDVLEALALRISFP